MEVTSYTVVVIVFEMHLGLPNCSLQIQDTFDPQSSASHKAYRSSPHSSSLPEPRHRLLSVRFISVALGWHRLQHTPAVDTARAV